MDIRFPSNTKDIIDRIRNTIGREVEFFVEDRIECTASGCGINPVMGGAINPSCPTCSGLGYIPVYSGYRVTAHISWNPSELLRWVAGGQYYSADCRVQIEYTEDNLEVCQNAKYAVIDNRELRVEKITLRGVPDINRILVDLKER